MYHRQYTAGSDGANRPLSDVLKAPELFTPHMQPSGKLKVNPRHPYANAIEHLYDFRDGSSQTTGFAFAETQSVCLVTGHRAGVYGQGADQIDIRPAYKGKRGIHMLADTYGGSIPILLDYYWQKAELEYTYMFYFLHDPSSSIVAAVQPMFGGYFVDGIQCAIGAHASGYATMDVRHFQAGANQQANRSFPNVPLSLSSGPTLICAAWSCTGNGDVIHSMNGEFSATAAGYLPAVFRTTGAGRIFNTWERQPFGSVYMACRWGKAMSGPALAALTADPYSIVSPADNFSMLTAASGFQPAWARQANVIIQQVKQ